MRKILTALFIGTLAAAVTISSADASQGCGRGWHRNGHGYCVRNHRRVVMAPPAYGPPPATRVQTIVPPAQTGVIPNPGNSVCPYGYHPTGQGKCAPN